MPRTSKKPEDDESASEGEEEVENLVPEGVTAADLMQNPALIAAVQAKLNGLVGTQTNFIEHLPQCVKNRIHALKNIQVECAKLEGKFYEEAHQLEMKYSELFKPLFDKRSTIVNAEYEPTEEESKWVEPGEEGEEQKPEADEKTEEIKNDEEKSEQQKLIDDVLNKLKMDENTKGIPEFWLSAMKNIELLEDMIQEHDEEILKHLLDVKLIFTGKKDAEDETDMGFVLEFIFSPNDFFTNTALTKTYKMKSEPDENDPFAFEGPDIVSCTGCKIDWNKGKNITQKQVKKKQKHKGRGQTRIVTKTVQNDSFFNFFDPPEVPENEEEMDSDTEAVLSADFEIGHFFRERLIPKAVLFYTGEAIEEDSDDEEFEDDEDDDNEDGDDDDDENDENDPDYKPAEGADKPAECKNQ